MPNPPSSYNAPTHRTAILPPAETGVLDLTLGGRGSNYSFTDPNFGTVITRITDENFWGASFTGRNHIPPDTAEARSFNIDSTKFFVMNLEGGVFTPCHWNGATRQATRMGSAAISSGGIWTSGILTGGSAIPSWSGKDANIMWGTLNFELRKLDYSTITGSSTTIPFTTILDYAAIYNTITGGTLTGALCSLGVSGVDAANDFVVTAMIGNQDNWTWVFWYNTATGAYKILDTSTSPIRYWDSTLGSWTNITGINGGWSLHNVKMDQSGRYVLLTVDNNDLAFLPANKGFLGSWDTTGNTISFTPSFFTATPWDGGHRCGGWQQMINQYANGSDATQWLMRPCSDLGQTPTFLVDPYLSDAASVPQYTALNPDFDEHSSWQTARNGVQNPFFSLPSRALAVDGSHPWRPYDNEGVAVGTGATRVVYRLFHHHSTRTSDLADGYYDYSFGQISPDGRYAIFSSNWNNTLGSFGGDERKDTFIATLPITESAPSTGSVKLIAICL